MEAVILVIHLIVALGIIGIVLIQPSEAGGFLGSSGSMSNMTAPRRSVDALTRITTILAGCFFMTSLVLAVLAEHHGARKSILDALPAASSPVKSAPASAAQKDAAPAPVQKQTAEPKKEKPAAPISK